MFYLDALIFSVLAVIIAAACFLCPWCVFQCKRRFSKRSPGKQLHTSEGSSAVDIESQQSTGSKLDGCLCKPHAPFTTKDAVWTVVKIAAAVAAAYLILIAIIAIYVSAYEDSLVFTPTCEYRIDRLGSCARLSRVCVPVTPAPDVGSVSVFTVFGILVYCSPLACDCGWDARSRWQWQQTARTRRTRTTAATSLLIQRGGASVVPCGLVCGWSAGFGMFEGRFSGWCRPLLTGSCLRRRTSSRRPAAL